MKTGMFSQAYAYYSLLRRHRSPLILKILEKILVVGKKFFFKTHSQAKTHREACGGGYAY
jgi:hypothetical protein